MPNYNPELYGTERIYVNYKEDPKTLHESLAKKISSDINNTPATSPEPNIPVTLFYKKEKLKKDGSMPLLLNGIKNIEFF